MDGSEAELLRSARKGDSSAIEELLQRHELQIYRFGLRMCGNEDAAREVLQDTLVAAVRHLPEFRGEAELSTWLYQVARSFCSKSHRRRVGQPSNSMSLDDSAVRSLADPAKEPEAATQAREIGELLHTAIVGLSVEHREAVVLKDVEGLSSEEAAKIAGLDIAAFKSRLHRARLELRDRITTLMGEDFEGGSVCPDLARELTGYVDGHIDQAACAHIEAHLEHCTRCRAGGQALRRSVSLCNQFQGESVPEPVRRAVRQAIRAMLSRPGESVSGA